MKYVHEFIAFIEGILPHEMGSDLHKEKLELQKALKKHGKESTIINAADYEKKLQMMLAKSKAEILTQPQEA